MSRFHLATPVAVILGPLLAVPVTLAVASGFGVMTLGWLAPPVGGLMGQVCDLSLLVMERAVSGAVALAGDYFWVTGLDEWWLIGLDGACMGG